MEVAVPNEQPAALSLPKQQTIGRSYTAHSNPGLEARVREGSVVIAKLYVHKRWGMGLCFARSCLFPCDVVINLPQLRGKALHGDVVALELLAVDQWQGVRVEQGEAQPDEAAANGAEGFEDDVVRKEAMPNSLPDGRPIVRALKTESETATSAHLPPYLRLHKEMGGPEHYDWPAGKRPVAKVVAVLHREMNVYHAGRISNVARKDPNEPVKGNYLYRFHLYDPLLPMVVVAGKNIPAPFHAKLENYLFLLRFVQGPDGDVVSPMGDMLEAVVHGSLGTTDSVTAGTAAICATYKISSETFPDDVEALVPDAVDIPATAEEVAAIGRRDLREEEFVCTIDPATARDLDDALSIRRNAGGGYHVGVHIADVSFFVEPNTPLDEEARERQTSTYFVDHVVPMLPRKLSEIHCSLNPNEDKFAFSSLFELDKDGHVVSEWFGRTVIRSRCRLAYEEAQEIIDGNDVELNLGIEQDNSSSAAAAADLKKKVFSSVRLLFEVATKRRNESVEHGRLTVGTTRLGFAFDNMNSKLAPRGFFVKRQIKANWLVEEFMLLANNRAAEKIVQFFPDGALLRHHLPPERKKMLALKAGLDRCNVRLAGSSAKKLQETLDACKGSKFYDGVCQLLVLSQHAAEYFGNDVNDARPRSHFALGLPWYTHFTSPIRRYCDIMAHRQLLAAVELEQLLLARGVELPGRQDPDVVRKPGEDIFDAQTVVDLDELQYKDYVYSCVEVNSVAAMANEAKENARQAGERSLELFFCMYLQALFKKAKEDPRIQPRQLTSVFVIKLTRGSLLLFSAEIALQVEVGVADTKQRFTLVTDADEDGGDEEKEMPRGRGNARPRVDGQGREINEQAKAAQRRKGGKANMSEDRQRGGGGGQSGNDTPNSILISWTDPTGEHEQAFEELSLFSELAVELVLVDKKGCTTLDMIILPPWERKAYFDTNMRIPTSLEPADDTLDEAPRH